MSDFGRGAQTADEDRLPWLEPVDDEAAGEGPGAGRLVLAVLVALAVIGLVVGGIFWLKDRPDDAATGAGDLIAAPPGAYKTRPDEPGGMAVEGQGDISYPASEGADTDGAIDLTKLPEAPVTEQKAVTAADATATAPQAKAAAAAPAPATRATPAATAPVPARATPAPKAAPPVKPAPAAAVPAAAPATGGTIQLGAFGSEAKANAAWKTMSKRFGFLAALTPAITPVASGEKTLYRLRIPAGAQAATICSKLTVAGETCVRVN